MNQHFLQAFTTLLEREGDYSDHPHDRGGKTRYGITEAVARHWGYPGAMSELPKSFAQQIYYEAYWRPLRLDDVAALSYALAYELFDTGVNMGITTAAKFLQQALNALNRQGRDYPDLVVDGLLGSKSLHALSEYLRRRGEVGERVLLTALNCLQGAYYIELARLDPSQETFLFGWLNHRVNLSPSHSQGA